MLLRLALQLRLLFSTVLLCAVASGPLFVAPTVAFADDDEGDEDDDDDDDEGDGDGDEEGDEGDEEEDGEPQPPVTAGGLYTKKTYPVAELARTLTVIGGMTEVRAGIDADVSDKTAFETWRLKVDARYGLQDNVEFQAGIDVQLAGDAPVASTTPTVVPPSFSVYAGMEAGLYFDVVDFRALIAVPITTTLDATTLEESSELGVDIIVGFPVRYKIKDKFAITALDELMTIHLAGGKPDLTVGVGGIFQALPPLAIIVRAEVTAPEFDTTELITPATAAIQFSPTNSVDIGGEFTFLDFTPPESANDDGPGPFDRRSLLLFIQARF